ncbi:hypothetical protein ID858_01495 [Xenorhabdus sp. DI]|uniref:hypothetical protein n=1 Tax=Xenorhabdus doucetiae TaxID=351671 RepID=UPI00198388B7|nr:MULTISPECIES: hypothetical protein [unclassified Xenorhabdus]MBD2784347.1 hypothetical protein [Xenorhabdus sp. 3]MBD2787188.1 hypothetical protein [Xenorhabdus sp. DI]
MNVFIKNGILALANVVNLDPNGWFQGHVGASFLAGAALLKSHALSKESSRSLKSRLEKQAEKYQDLLVPLEPSEFTSDYTPIIEAIALNSQQLSRSGHGVIYGALFLKTVSSHQVRVTKKAVSNIAKLILNGTSDKWDRYFGLDDYRQYPLPNIKVPDIKSLCALAVTRSTRDVCLDADGYFFTGEKIHGVTHAHAILLLDELGLHDLAQKASQQLVKQLELNELAPKSGLQFAHPKRFDLSDPTIWDIGFKDEHQIKLAYSYFELSQKLNKKLPDINHLWGAIS